MPAARSPAPTRPARVVAVLPCKGGAGATFIAANLAHALAADGLRTCLLDLNFPFGEAALYLTDELPCRTIADLAGQHARLDAALLESCLTPVAEKLWLLAAADAPERALGIGIEDIETLLAVARSAFDCVVLDLGRAIDAGLVRALDAADDIHLVLQATVPFVRNAGRLLRLMRALNYPEGRTRLLLNRYQKGADIAVADIERTLGKPVAHVLPNRFGTVAAAIDQGRPVLDLAPADAISRELRALGRALSGREDTGTAPRQPWWRLARQGA